MALPSISTPKVKIVNKDLEAWIRLPALEEGEHYTIEYLHDVLRVNQITYGIDEAQLQKILDEEIYEQDVLVARGIPAVEGQDGFYEYKVNMNLEKKPKILPDGSVDYWSMYSVQSVQKDQVIAIYHPAVKGTDGIGVSGKPIAARVAREQGTLRGTGFGRSEDYLTYFSLMDGKIDIENDKIRIQPIYEVSGDANLTTGSIDFTGDIVIHGSVESGVTIKATGSITIDGNVEACNLEAGKDIILRSGMVGGNKAHVRTKGNLNCTVACRGSILIQGRTAKIIGGDVSAVKGIKATTIGNDAEMRTAVTVGVSADCISRLNLLKKKMDITKMELDKIEQGLAKFEEMQKERGVSYKEDPRRVALLRTRIQNTATLAGDEGEVKRLERMISDGANATVCVTRDVFPGVSIAIRDQVLNVKNNAKCVEFYHLNGKICTRTAED